MSFWILRLGIIIVSFLLTLQTGGKQGPVEVPKVGKTLSADKVEIVYTSQGRGEIAVIFIHGTDYGSEKIIEPELQKCGI